MDIICDVHLPFKLVKKLTNHGFKAVHLNNILSGDKTKDSDIAAFADNNGAIIISKDIDFRDSHFIKGKPEKLIRVLLGNISNKELLEIFESIIPEIKELKKLKSFYAEVGKAGLKIFNKNDHNR